MKKTKRNNYYTFYKKHRALGWRSTYCFGPPELIEAVKKFVGDYKREHKLYTNSGYPKRD